MSDVGVESIGPVPLPRRRLRGLHGHSGDVACPDPAGSSIPALTPEVLPPPSNRLSSARNSPSPLLGASPAHVPHTTVFRGHQQYPPCCSAIPDGIVLRG
jgi:hypothetical protein